MAVMAKVKANAKYVTLSVFEDGGCALPWAQVLNIKTDNVMSRIVSLLM